MIDPKRLLRVPQCIVTCILARLFLIIEETVPPAAIHGFIPLLPLTCVWFATFSLRVILLPGVWTIYVPIVSPVFGLGPQLIDSWHPIIGYVFSGVLMLTCGVLQLDKALRRSRPDIHRWTGRLYVLAGCIMLASLRPLREASGSLAMMLFIDVVSAAWILSTAVAVLQAAIRRDYVAYRKWGVTSLAFAMTPVAQRVTLLPMTPAIMAWRICVDAVWHGIPFWESVWGEVPTAWTGAATGPHVLSREGYGVAENLGFQLSAWAGLFEMIYLVYVVAWSSEERPTKEEEEDAEAASLPAEDEAAAVIESQAPDKGSGGANTDFNVIFELNTLDILPIVRRYLPKAFVFQWGKLYPKEIFDSAVETFRTFVLSPFVRTDEGHGLCSPQELVRRCVKLVAVVATTLVAGFFFVLGNALCTTAVGMMLVTVELGFGVGFAYPAYIAHGFWVGQNSTNN